MKALEEQNENGQEVRPGRPVVIPTVVSSSWYYFSGGRVVYYEQKVLTCFCVCVRVTLMLVRSNVCVCSTSRASLRCLRSTFSCRWLSCYHRTSLWLERECSQGSAWTCHKTCVCIDVHSYTQTWSYPYSVCQRMKIYSAIYKFVMCYCASPIVFFAKTAVNRKYLPCNVTVYWSPSGNVREQSQRQNGAVPLEPNQCFALLFSNTFCIRKHWAHILWLIDRSP